MVSRTNSEGTNMRLSCNTTRGDDQPDGTFNNLRLPESSPGSGNPYEMDVFTDSQDFHDDTPAASTAFTHSADGTIIWRQNTLPSSGLQAVRFRTDWAVEINSSGDGELFEDHDGTPVSRATQTGLANDGSDSIRLVHIVMNDEYISVSGDASDNMNYGSASANKTTTSGEVNSLGTGGVIGVIAGYPATHTDYDTLDTL